jgi:peroxiredoxin
VRLVAISPDPPAVLARLRAELGIGFELVSDEDEEAVTSMCAGLAHCQLVLDAAGVIRWARGSESNDARLPPAALLDVARGS